MEVGSSIPSCDIKFDSSCYEHSNLFDPHATQPEPEDPTTYKLDHDILGPPPPELLQLGYNIEGIVLVPRGEGLRTVGPPWNVEEIRDYVPGGHHPVHLHDHINQRYKVIHKLGSGGAGNVWLCRDTLEGLKYVAVKVLMAVDSHENCRELEMNKIVSSRVKKNLLKELFCMPLDKFQIKGPNGTHNVFVYPLLGPPVSEVSALLRSEDRHKVLRTICLQATRALATLHEAGICHGDFRPQNILTRVTGLDGLSEEMIMEIVGKPTTTKVYGRIKTPPGQNPAPKELVYGVKWSDFPSDYVSDQIAVVDLGEAFEALSPTFTSCIPADYESPEWVMDKAVGLEGDIWSLGLTLYRILTGSTMIQTWWEHEEDPSEYLAQLTQIFGKLPERWWSAWDKRAKYFEDGVDELGRAVLVNKTDDASLRSQSIKEMLTGHEVESADGESSIITRAFPDEEVNLFADVLERFLCLEPTQRAKPSEMLSHPWFSFEPKTEGSSMAGIDIST